MAHLLDTLATKRARKSLVIGCAALGLVVARAASAQELPAALNVLVTSYEAKLNATDAAGGDQFGYSAAISGDTAIVGARFDGGTGSAYIFTHAQGGAGAWGQVAKLTPSDGGDGDEFGSSVAIEGDTAIVGAPFNYAGGIFRSGAAYVFKRNQGGSDAWGQVAKLTASDAWFSDHLGTSVAISGDTVIAGAVEANIPGTSDCGAAFVYMRNQGGPDQWGEVAKINAADAETGNKFGDAVAISGDTAIVGSYGDDVGGAGNSGSAYIFRRNQGGSANWGQLAKLTAPDGEDGDQFGSSVAINIDTAVVGAHYDDVAGIAWAGSAHVFARNQGGADAWGHVAMLTASDASGSERLGVSVAIDGDTVVAGAPSDVLPGVGTSGSAYVFDRNRGGADVWGQASKLTAPDAEFEDRFASSLAISDDRVVIGAFSEDPGGMTAAGSAYVFRRSGEEWVEEAKPVAPDAVADDSFGVVAINGDLAVVGATGDDHSAKGNAGSAYIFERNEDGADAWGLVTKIFASDPSDNAAFGNALSMAGSKVVVGAPGDDPGRLSQAGSAYVFERNQGGSDTWGQVAKLIASDSQSSARFGSAVSISHETAVVGAPYASASGQNQAGAAYVYRYHSTWAETALLTASDGASYDHFGKSIATSGDTVIVGAEGDDHSGYNDAGSAYIFSRNQGGGDVWGQVTKIAAGDPGADQRFGTSVALSGAAAAVGAFGGPNAIYIFDRNQWGADVWGQVKKISAADVGAGSEFGSVLAIDGDRLVAGTSSQSDQTGTAYIFERHHGGTDNWGLVHQLTASDGQQLDLFGSHVAISNHTVAVGAIGDDDGGASSGSAYVFRLSRSTAAAVFSDGFESGNTSFWSTTMSK